MDFSTFKRHISELSTAAQRASSLTASCRELLSSKLADVKAACAYIGPKCDMHAVAADMQLFKQLCQIAVAGIAAVTPNDAPVPKEVLDACSSISLALQNTSLVFMDFGRFPEPDFMPEWSAAVKPIILQLQQLKQQDTSAPAAPPAASAGSQEKAAEPAEVRAAAFLQHLWVVATSSTMERPAVFNSKVLPSMSDAAELAVLLLTVPRAPAAATGGDDEHDAAPAAPPPELPADRVQKVASLAHTSASQTLHLISQYLCMHGMAYIHVPASAPAVLVSDAVQMAVALNLAVWLAAYGGQHQAGQASASRLWLEEVGFPVGTAKAYTNGLLTTFGPDGPTAPATSIEQAASSLQFALMMRAGATTVPGWQQRYADCIAASATATAPAPVPGRAIGVELPRDGRLFAPGVNPVQLQQLVLEVSAYGSECGSYMLFAAFLDLALNVVMGATPTTHNPAEVVGAVQRLWLGLGRKLLLLSGVPAADLVDTSISGGEDNAPAAGEAVVTPLPASAGGQLKQMWARFALCLFRTLSYAAKGGVTTEMVAQAVFLAHPVLASRVYEAAARACTPQTVLSIGTLLPIAQVTEGLEFAAQVCNPAQLPAKALLTDTKLAARMGSQLVSSVKQLQVASAPGYDSQLLCTLLDIANLAATTASSVWAKAGAETLAAASTPSTQQAVLKMAAPTLGTWLFTTGRALSETGRLLAHAPAWLESSAPQNTSTRQLSRRVASVSKHAEVLSFLQSVLDDLATAAAAADAPSPAPNADAASGSTDTAAAAAAPAVSAAGIASLQGLQKQVTDLLGQYGPLLEQCRAAEASGDTQSLSAALDAFVAACGSGSWVAKGLQELGAAVCSAFPQSFTCNDPSCTVMDGLTESLKKCSACQVARYCSRGHQSGHWKQHTVACKQVAAAAAQQSQAATCAIQ